MSVSFPEKKPLQVVQPVQSLEPAGSLAIFVEMSPILLTTTLILTCVPAKVAIVMLASKSV